MMLFLLYLVSVVFCCTNFIVTPGASVNGETLISYASDSHVLYGALYHFPAKDWPKGSYIDIVDWDSLKYLGKIPQVNHTYNVVGFMNEFQVTITETTYGGREELASQPDAVLDYGNLMWITLQRSKTAKEAIKVLTDLVATYGYASDGESFSIGDPNEAWILDLIGKGKDELGAVWVARRVPDGYISGHANQARIEKFPLNDPENCIYSHDVITFAQKKGFYPKEGKPEDFSFSEAYDPISAFGARFCDARVFSFFSQVSDVSKWLEYVKGKNLSERLPLWVKPTRKISVRDVQNFMRSHYEGTWFDMSKDFGAEPFKFPIRWRPMTWINPKNQKTYLNERAVATQQTGMSMVAQMRKNFFDPIGGILWFGVDDTSTTVYCPFYCGITDIPDSFRDKENGIMEFSLDSAFWVFNMVAHYAYLRWDVVYPEIAKKILEMAEKYEIDVKKIDSDASEMYKKDPEQAIKMITEFSVGAGNMLLNEWFKFYSYLFPRYLDGDVKTAVPKEPLPKVETPGYSKEWYAEIIAKTGDHFLLPESDEGVQDNVLRKLKKLKGI